MTHKSKKKKKQGGSLKKGKDLFRETESETRYRELFELESDAVILIDNETGNILEANHAAIALYGYSREELLARKNTDLSAEPEQTEKITRQTAADKNRVVHIPIRYHRKKDGTVFPCEITGRFFLHQGKSVHIAAIRDITERKRAEEALYSSQNMLQTVLDTIPAAVFWKDRDLHYLGGNRTWLDAVGIKSSEAVVGKSDYDLPWEKAQADSFRKDDKRVMESGAGEYNIIEPYLRADGTHAWARTNKVPLRDEKGNVIGVLGTYEDITERKRMEEELYNAQKLESLGLLAGGIAHDFNNLLTGIFSHIDLARAASKDGVVSNYLSTALSAIDRARNLTGQLLTFAKGGAPVLETGDLSPVIRNSSKLALSGSNVSSVLNIPDGLWPCNFDKNQIGQVIDNMVLNARAAMPDGGTILISATNISLKVGEKGATRAGNYVRISIHDDGIGIPEDILPKIFDPFFTTKQTGSGLGLAICHSIVKRHDGWIDVESAPGKGTTFHLYVPASRKTSAELSPQKPVSFHKGSGRILIMDDEEIIRQSVAKILDTLGYSVECRRDGKETLAFLTEETRAGRSFSAILLDLTVPGGMGGKEVAVEIRKMNINIPLFVTSGYSNDPVISNPTIYGFTDSICKPFTIDDLAAMLNRHLRKNP